MTLFILRTSFVVHDERYFVLLDDEMISMRYARNLVNGQGLVWNPGGERVEGYTNPLWVGVMALAHCLPLQPSKVSLVLQVCGAILFLGTLSLIRQLAAELSDGSGLASFSSVALSIVFYPFYYWYLMGTEVSVLAPLVCWCVLRTLRGLRAGQLSASVYWVLGLGTWIRVDMLVPALSLLGFLVVFDSVGRRRHLLLGFSILGAFLLAQTLFRLWYFGELLPNTYYLKMTGAPLLVRLAKGLLVTLTTIWRMNWILFVLPLAFVLIELRRARLLIWVLLGQFFYSIWVGGDFMESDIAANRYVSIGLPLYFVMAGLALDRARRWNPRLAPGLLVLGVLNFSLPFGLHSLTELLLLRKPHLVSMNQDEVEKALLLRDFSASSTTIAVAAAGVIPYFADLRSIDISGKNDKTIARLPTRISTDMAGINAFQPGHNKWSYAHSIGELEPDIIVELFKRVEEAKPFVEGKYLRVKLMPKNFVFFLLQGSTNIHAERLGAIRQEFVAVYSMTPLLWRQVKP